MLNQMFYLSIPSRLYIYGESLFLSLWGCLGSSFTQSVATRFAGGICLEAGLTLAQFTAAHLAGTHLAHGGAHD
jgi:hypothetical protein